MSLIGRAPEQLSIDERLAAAGQWAALEIYTPQETPRRTIAAVGASVRECIRQLQQQGRDPRQFEFVLITPLYA